jgi:hypothetical protein
MKIVNGDLKHPVYIQEVEPLKQGVVSFNLLNGFNTLER